MPLLVSQTVKDDAFLGTKKVPPSTSVAFRPSRVDGASIRVVWL
jgi:hypothetical protein